MGEIGTQLSKVGLYEKIPSKPLLLDLSPMFTMEEDEVVFHPIAHSTTVFDTPIRQIETLPDGANPAGPASFIVRTYGKTTFLKVSATMPYGDDPRHFRPKTFPLASLNSSSTGGYPIVDIALRDNGTQSVFVTSKGQAYSTSFKDNGALDWYVKSDILLTHQIDGLFQYEAHKWHRRGWVIRFLACSVVQWTRGRPVCVGEGTIHH